ncbi:MAG TPA: glycosyltransferase family 2 protein [Beijerinckiaceae bacterium]|nr:glycosyltransferase family 2 protein [Beijerinckiaceae bacterium]
MSVTAIIVAHDSAGILPDCLAALARDGVPALVVDNASADDTVAVAEAAGARVIRNRLNEGYGRANDKGVVAADSDFCLILNPDIVLDPGCVARLLQAAADYPDAGLWAPSIIEDDGRFFFQNRSLLAESVVRGPVSGDARAVPPEGDCCAPFLSGACFLVRRQVFLAAGGFDPNIFLFYEDDDLCRRLQDGGRPLVHVHDAVARHGRGQSAPPTPERRYRSRWHYGWSRIYVARKYGLPTGAAWTLAMNLPKALGVVFTLNRMEIARYWGLVAGTIAGLAGRSAIGREGLSRRD